MRTPLEIARTLGWPEAKAKDACLHLRLTEARDCPTCGPTIAVELRRATTPKLRVHRSKCIRRDGTARWLWEVRQGGEIIDYGDGINWAVALHVGLAALDTARVRAKVGP